MPLTNWKGLKPGMPTPPPAALAADAEPPDWGGGGGEGEGGGGGGGGEGTGTGTGTGAGAGAGRGAAPDEAAEAALAPLAAAALAPAPAAAAAALLAPVDRWSNQLSSRQPRRYTRRYDQSDPHCGAGMPRSTWRGRGLLAVLCLPCRGQAPASVLVIVWSLEAVHVTLAWLTCSRGCA